MKKIPVSEESKQTTEATPLKISPSFAASATATGADQSDTEDPMAGLQADLDRFRDLALRSQADFEN